jgi:predicted regulator of Ras-like GTPase activity (Roadblock/LC7/MglB family)
MDNTFQEITSKMKQQLPGAIATAIFSITDGLILAIDSDIPESDRDAMSASHTIIWDKINTFLRLLPKEIVGDMTSMVLELKGANFYVSVDKGYQIALLAACDTNNGNLGLLRVISRRYLNKTLLALSHM